MNTQKATFTIVADESTLQHISHFLEQLASKEQLIFTMSIPQDTEKEYQPSTARIALANHLLKKNDGLYQRLA
jgi:hypothetical protein